MVREIEHSRRRIARTHMRPITTIMLVAPPDADDTPADVQAAAERVGPERADV
jgi:hypothetical protein